MWYFVLLLNLSPTSGVYFTGHSIREKYWAHEGTKAGLSNIGKYSTVMSRATCFSHVTSDETWTSVVYLRILSSDDPASGFLNNARVTINIPTLPRSIYKKKQIISIPFHKLNYCKLVIYTFLWWKATTPQFDIKFSRRPIHQLIEIYLWAEVEGNKYANKLLV